MAGYGQMGQNLGNQVRGYQGALAGYGMQGDNLGRQGQNLDRQGQNYMNQAGMLNQSNQNMGNLINANLANSGFMSNMYDRQLQDYVSRQNSMDQARLAAMGYQQQGNMADYNSPSNFDRLLQVGNVASKFFNPFG